MIIFENWCFMLCVSQCEDERKWRRMRKEEEEEGEIEGRIKQVGESRTKKMSVASETQSSKSKTLQSLLQNSSDMIRHCVNGLWLMAQI